MSDVREQEEIDVRARTLGLVCARGGSKGVPRKNLVALEGLPLIVHTINAFLKWGGADRILCSTDDTEIAAVAKSAGASVPWLRPEVFATDSASKMVVMTHALREAEREDGVRYDFVVDLDVAAPLRTVEDIEGTFRSLVDSNADSAFSVGPSRGNPYFDMVEIGANGLASLVKPQSGAPQSRQGSPTVYTINASVYAFKREFLLSGPLSPVGERTVVYVMPPERSIEIDEQLDLLIVEAILGGGLATLPKPLEGNSIRFARRWPK